MLATKILLVDDHPLFRDGFIGMAATLRPAWRLASARTAAEAIDIIASEQLHLVVIDIVLPGGDGFALAECIGCDWPSLAYMLISGRDDLAAHARARTCGARGFIGKGTAPDEIVTTIDLVLSGGVSFPQAMPALPVALTQRQSEVLFLLAEGCSNKDMRHRLAIAERTVRAHLTDLFQLLGVHSRMQAVVRARELGLVG